MPDNVDSKQQAFPSGFLPSQLTKEAFILQFGGIYEHSEWVAQRTFEAGCGTQLDSLKGLSRAMSDTMDKASQEEKLALIRAHPDLAGKAAAAGTLTADSNLEQSSAGLDQCSEAELARFHELNDAYKSKFDFPFIMAVKDSNRHLILAAFESRIHNTPELEFETAIGEINKIARLRLAAFFQ